MKYTVTDTLDSGAVHAQSKTSLTVFDRELQITIARFATPAEAKGFITSYGQLGTRSDMLAVTLDK